MKDVTIMKENAKENELVKKLTNKHYTITTAESCTGGLLSATIINVSGASGCHTTVLM